MAIDRRTFMALSLAGAATGLAIGSGFAASPASGQASQAAQAASPDLSPLPLTRKGDMPYRPLGSTGEEVSILGLGGSHIGKVEDEKEAIAIMRRAIDNGLTFMDNSWDYSGGASEERMGKALRDGYRDKAFLMTKFDGRDRKTAARQIEESLRRLRTDHVDLLQFHEVIRYEDPDRFFAEGGAAEALTEARKSGKARYIGFTGHKDPAIHLHMLDLAERNGYGFDTVQMPLNVMDAHFRSFQHQVLPELVRRRVGILGMKSMGGGVILRSGAVKPEECLRYALTLPTSVVITGIDSREILDQALRVARDFEPLTQAQAEDLLARTRQAADEGQYELFKTSSTFDSTAHNPEWLGPPT